MHIFPACRLIDGKCYTFSDEKCKDNIEWIEDIINNQDKIKGLNSGNSEAICHGDGVTVANSKREKYSIAYFDNQAETRTYAANRQNARRNICGNCVKRLYKD